MNYGDYIKRKLPRTINWLMIFWGIIVLGVCVVNFSTIEEYLRPLLLLPLTYLACVLGLLLVSNKNTYSIIHSAVFAFFSIQYLAFPLYVFCLGEYNLSRYNESIKNHVADAVLLQCLVLIMVLFYAVVSKKAISFESKAINKSDLFYSKWAKRLIFLLLTISLILLIIYPQFLLKFRLIFYSKANSYISFVDASRTVKNSMPILVYQLGLWTLQITKLLVVYYLVIIIWRGSNPNNEIFRIILSTVVIAASCIITTEDKAATVFCAIALVLLMMRLYEKHARTIIKLSGALIATIILAVFIILPLMMSDSLDELGYKLNAYFSGTINVAGGFLMEQNDLIKCFFGDIFRSIPLFNHFFTNWPMSYLEFNTAIGYDTKYNSQIIPMISQGYYYFNIVGAVAYPILLISYIKKIFTKMMNSYGSYEFFTYSMIFVFSFMGLFLYDLALTFAQLMNYCFPIYLVFLVSKRKVRTQ